MARDEYGIYRKPTGSVIAAWLGIAAAIFFGAYAFKMKDRLQQAQDHLQNAREEANQMKLQMVGQMGELQALRREVQYLKESGGLTPAGASTQETSGTAITTAPLAPVTSAASGSGKPSVPNLRTEAGFKAEALPSNPSRPTGPALSPSRVTGETAEAGTKPAGGQKEATAQPTKSEPIQLPPSEDKISANDPTRLSGEILTYNPDTRKATLSLGSATSGLQPGSRFSVWRGDKYVTDIRVVDVFSVTSTCEVEGPTPIGVRAGDIAKLATKPSGT